MSAPTVEVPYLIGYTSQYDAVRGGFNYRYGRLDQDYVLTCPHEFRRGDAVVIEGIRDRDRVVVLARAPATIRPQAALLLASPGVPLDPAAQYEFRAHGCALLHNWHAVLRGNATYVSLVGVPLAGRSALVATKVGTDERFRYTFRGVDNV